MPAAGDQHRSNSATTNPFEEPQKHISTYTAEQVATLQARLNRFLGPEYISSRDGPGGKKVHYIAAVQCIQLANEVFGFNGWSSSIREVQVDYVEEIPHTGKFNMAVSVIMRVTLRDGTYHEDIGYGMIENCKSKAMGFEKTKKEATTDALKRALRNFGNVLGNCIYDKDYVGKVTKIKTKPRKFEVDDLHRHVDFVPLKQESAVSDTPMTGLQETKQSTTNNVLQPNTKIAVEDEFDAADFDAVDFSVADHLHPDEVVVDEAIDSNRLPSNNIPGNQRMTNAQNLPEQGNRPPPQTIPRQAQRPAPQSHNQQPAIKNERVHPPQQAATLSENPSHNIMPQSNRNIPPIQGTKPLPHTNPTTNHGLEKNLPDANGGYIAPSDTTGTTPVFFSARVATMLQTPDTAGPAPTAVFNPHAQSPSIRKTAGVDHTKSMRLWKEIDPEKDSTQIISVAPKSNQPSIEGPRRIGMPPSAMSPAAGRSSYKPPLKRPLEGVNHALPRTPLNDKTTAASNTGPPPVVSDQKRPRIENESAVKAIS